MHSPFYRHLIRSLPALSPFAKPRQVLPRRCFPCNLLLLSSFFKNSKHAWQHLKVTRLIPTPASALSPSPPPQAGRAMALCWENVVSVWMMCLTHFLSDCYSPPSCLTSFLSEGFRNCSCFLFFLLFHFLSAFIIHFHCNCGCVCLCLPLSFFLSLALRSCLLILLQFLPSSSSNLSPSSSLPSVSLSISILSKCESEQEWSSSNSFYFASSFLSLLPFSNILFIVSILPFCNYYSFFFLSVSVTFL